MMNYGKALRQEIATRRIMCFIGVYDNFSASIAAQHYDGLFISGFGFAASHYGLPDIGFITWSDIVAYMQRVRTILPEHHIIVDIDDGYGDQEVAAHVVSLLEREGASGVILEDQKRPRRCGHYDGKQLLELDQFIDKLEKVLQARKNLFVVARTDSTDQADRLERALAFEQAGADAVLIDGLENLDVLRDISRQLKRPLMFNQIAGGKSPPCSLSELAEAGVSLVNYSTPCLFTAQEAIDKAMHELKKDDGKLPDTTGGARVDLRMCTELLNENLVRRDLREET